MPFDLKRVLESKQSQRKQLAGRPLSEKLALLDALRDRTLAIQAAAAGGKLKASDPRDPTSQTQ